MTRDDSHQVPSAAVAAADVASQRLCLRCRNAFKSEGFGERICPRCKRSRTWNSGAAVRGTGTRKN